MEIIQSYVLEASIAKMIINDANVLNENITTVISSLQAIGDERWKYWNTKELKKLEERHFELFDKYYFDDSQEIIRLRNSELDRHIIMTQVRNFLTSHKNRTSTYNHRWEVVDFIKFLTRCPRFVGSNLSFKKSMLEKCVELRDRYDDFNLIERIDKYEKLIMKY